MDLYKHCDTVQNASADCADGSLRMYARTRLLDAAHVLSSLGSACNMMSTNTLCDDQKESSSRSGEPLPSIAALCESVDAHCDGPVPTEGAITNTVNPWDRNVPVVQRVGTSLNSGATWEMVGRRQLANNGPLLLGDSLVSGYKLRCATDEHLFSPLDTPVSVPNVTRLLVYPSASAEVHLENREYNHTTSPRKRKRNEKISALKTGGVHEDSEKEHDSALSAVEIDERQSPKKRRNTGKRTRKTNMPDKVSEGALQPILSIGSDASVGEKKIESREFSENAFGNAAILEDLENQKQFMRNCKEKEYTCPNAGCNSVFSRWHNLKVHTRRHSNEKPYRCRYEGCTKTFKWKSSIVYHEQTHRKQSM
mmetsp:Transcript_7600/g.13773  ORF Transcript_7600/g.13773 Transcript_7600/m.13773 type:complete len:366 (-) Transcript_7600:308-1405(-)